MSHVHVDSFNPCVMHRQGTAHRGLSRSLLHIELFHWASIRRRRGALSAEGDEGGGRRSNYKLVGFTSPRLPPPRPVTHTALGLAVLGNHGYNGGMGLGAPLENNLLIPRGGGGLRREGENLGVTGQVLTMSPPLTRASTLNHVLQPPSCTTTSPPKEPRPDTGPPWHQASSGIFNQACFTLSSFFLFFLKGCATKSSFHRIPLARTWIKSVSLKHFNYGSKLWWAMTCLIGWIRWP